MLHKVKTALLVLFILISALLWAVQPAQAMRRESGPAAAPVARALTLEEALDLSLAMGDGRQVNFAPFGLGWES